MENIGTRQTGNNQFLQNTATAEAAYVLPRLRTALAYTNVINQQDHSTGTDTRIAHVVRPNVVYSDPRLTVGGAYTMTRGDENSSFAIPFWSHQGDGWFRYACTPTITPGVAGFYQFQEPDFGRHFSIGRGRATGAFGFGPDGTLEVAGGADLYTRQGDSDQGGAQLFPLLYPPVCCFCRQRPLRARLCQQCFGGGR